MAAVAQGIMDNNEFSSYGQQYGLQLVDRMALAVPETHKLSILGCVDLFHEMLNSSVTAPEELQHAADDQVTAGTKL